MLFLTWQKEPINDDQKDDLHTSYQYSLWFGSAADVDVIIDYPVHYGYKQLLCKDVKNDILTH